MSDLYRADDLYRGTDLYRGGDVETTAITGFDPPQGAVNAAVTIAGTFANVTAVKFGGISALDYVLNSEIVALVPEGAVDGVITVETIGASTDSADSFTILPDFVPYPPPIITSISPTSGKPGDSITLYGINFGRTDSLSFFDHIDAAFSVGAGGTTISTTVPQGAQTGFVRVITDGGSANSSTFVIATVIPAPGPPSNEIIPIYQVIIVDRNGNKRAEVNHKNLQYSFIRNSAGSVSFDLDLFDPKNRPSDIQPITREVWIVRNGVRVWGGYIWRIDSSYDGKSIAIQGEGYFSMLRRRYIDWNVSETNKEQLDTVWGFIQKTQLQPNGDLGFTRRSVSSSGVHRSVTYHDFERKIVSEAITDMASLAQGFDFEVTPKKEWVPYFPFKGVESGITFELGVNVTGMSFTQDGTNTANEITAVGAQTDTGTLLSVARDTPGQLDFGLLQDSTSHTDFTLSASLDAAALEDLRVAKTIRSDPQLGTVSLGNPPFGAVTVGDHVKVKANAGFMQINGKYRVQTIVVQLGNSGKEAISYTFDDPVEDVFL